MTDRILVAYGTRHGSTAEIAEAIAERLWAAGLDVDLRRARDVRSLAAYRAVVLGSAVYTARWRRDAARLLRRHRRDLAQRDVWLFSSGPVGKQADQDEARAETFRGGHDRLPGRGGDHAAGRRARSGRAARCGATLGQRRHEEVAEALVRVVDCRLSHAPKVAPDGS